MPEKMKMPSKDMYYAQTKNLWKSKLYDDCKRTGKWRQPIPKTKYGKESLANSGSHTPYPFHTATPGEESTDTRPELGVPAADDILHVPGLPILHTPTAKPKLRRDDKNHRKRRTGERKIYRRPSRQRSRRTDRD